MKITSETHKNGIVALRGAEIAFDKDGNLLGVVGRTGLPHRLETPEPIEPHHLTQMRAMTRDFKIEDDPGADKLPQGAAPVTEDSRLFNSQTDGNWASYGAGIPVIEPDNESLQKDFGFTLLNREQARENAVTIAEGYPRSKPKAEQAEAQAELVSLQAGIDQVADLQGIKSAVKETKAIAREARVEAKEAEKHAEEAAKANHR